MSDDLISRKALKQAIDHDFYEHYTKYHDTDQRALIDMVMDDIDEMPTAFDKEKVIEKLKDQYNYSRKVRNKNDNDYFEYWDGRTDSYKDAIEIVEKGGVE